MVQYGGEQAVLGTPCLCRGGHERAEIFKRLEYEFSHYLAIGRNWCEVPLSWNSVLYVAIKINNQHVRRLIQVFRAFDRLGTTHRIIAPEIFQRYLHAILICLEDVHQCRRRSVHHRQFEHTSGCGITNFLLRITFLALPIRDVVPEHRVFNLPIIFCEKLDDFIQRLTCVVLRPVWTKF